MKKIIALILTLVICLSLCSCGKKSTETNSTTPEVVEDCISSEKDAVGTYKSVGIFSDAEYCLNENTTFDVTDGRKGTFTVENKDEIRLKAKDEPMDIWTKKGNYFYSTDENCLTNVYDEDTEYNLKPTFDENGRSNQSFETGETELYDYTAEFILELKSDGTFVAKHTKFDAQTFDYEFKKKYKGTYEFKDDVLTLTTKKQKYIMILDNDKLFIDIIEKVN